MILLVIGTHCTQHPPDKDLSKFYMAVMWCLTEHLWLEWVSFIGIFKLTGSFSTPKSKGVRATSWSLNIALAPCPDLWWLFYFIIWFCSLKVLFAIVSQGFWCPSLGLCLSDVQELAAGDPSALAAATLTLVKQPQRGKEVFACSVPGINASASPKNEQEANESWFLQIVKLLKE